MLGTLITCNNHKACDKCALIRCCPVRLQVRLQTREAEVREHRWWPSWLVVEILGSDSNRQRQPTVT